MIIGTEEFWTEKFEKNTMIVRKNLDLKVIVYYMWKSLLYYLLLAISVFFLDLKLQLGSVSIPIYTITILSTALAIFLGFNNNRAYDRWREARKIWGRIINSSLQPTIQKFTTPRNKGNHSLLH